MADCDKEMIYNGLPSSIREALELGTLPEPFHGDPSANVYLLCGNPRNSDEDKNFIDCGSPVGGYRNIYEKEVCEELKHVNPEFIWLRDEETIKDADGNPYLGYKWWKTLCRKLAEAVGNVSWSLFCIEYFPYHTKHKMAFDKIKLPSNDYTDWLIRKAMEDDKIIIVMRSYREWCERIPELANYGKLIRLKNCQRVYLTAGNMSAKNWTDLTNAMKTANAKNGRKPNKWS